MPAFVGAGAAWLAGAGDASVVGAGAAWLVGAGDACTARSVGGPSEKVAGSACQVFYAGARAAMTARRSRSTARVHGPGFAITRT